MQLLIMKQDRLPHYKGDIVEIVTVAAQDRSTSVDSQSRSITAGGPTRSQTVFDDNDGTA